MSGGIGDAWAPRGERVIDHVPPARRTARISYHDEHDQRYSSVQMQTRPSIKISWDAR
jgi:hypothetical protein